MKTKDFNKEVESIIKNFPHTKKDNVYTVETILGKLQITSDPKPKIKLYSIYMRFLEQDKFNKDFFNEWIKCKYDSFNYFSLKWNLYNEDSDFVLGELEERLNNLKN